MSIDSHITITPEPAPKAPASRQVPFDIVGKPIVDAMMQNVPAFIARYDTDGDGKLVGSKISLDPAVLREGIARSVREDVLRPFDRDGLEGLSREEVASANAALGTMAQQHRFFPDVAGVVDFLRKQGRTVTTDYVLGVVAQYNHDIVQDYLTMPLPTSGSTDKTPVR